MAGGLYPLPRYIRFIYIYVLVRFSKGNKYIFK